MAAAVQAAPQPSVSGEHAQTDTDALITYLMGLDSRAMRLLQSRLSDLGYYSGPPGGAADEATFAAVLTFQRDYPGPVEELEKRIRAAASEHGHGNDIVEDGGKLHLRREAGAGHKPLCLDLPGRSDCEGGGK